MITKTLFGLALTAATLALSWAADFHPLDVKPGQWESTVTVETNGMPPIPPEALARMTPEQRAKLEERTKSLSNRTIIRKSCIKKEKLDKPITWGNADKACTYTLVTSTSTAQEVHVECSKENRKSSGTIRVEALSPESVKGTVQMTMTMGDRTMDINSSFTTKYIGAACTTDN